MQSIDFKKIIEINFWEAAPKRIGYVRQFYVDALLRYLGSSLVKVLVGQRRAGKSTVLKQVIQYLLSQGANSKNILFLNFELHQLQWIKTQAVLAQVIDTYFSQYKPRGKVYLFLDEIQEVSQWEIVINSFLADERYDVEIFITGSNANLLSTELSTYLTGRYVELTIYPFSYAEYIDYRQLKNSHASLSEYLDSSGLPELFSLPDRDQKIAYLSALKDSVVMNDVVKRFQIKHPKLLMLLLDFLLDNIGKLFSLRAIAKKLESIASSVNVITLGNYVHYLELTFLLHAVRRYDVRGKKLLEGERKYYVNDLGFSNYLQNGFDHHMTRRLENYVYLFLRQSGYQVYVGGLYQLEIDFIAEKNNERLYVQVTYLLASEDVIAREYGVLEKIHDHWPKWVVSLDQITIPPKEGIHHCPAWELFRLQG